MKKSLWQWFLALFGKQQHMPIVIKNEQQGQKESQQKTIRRWWH